MTGGLIALTAAGLVLAAYVAWCDPATQRAIATVAMLVLFGRPASRHRVSRYAERHAAPADAGRHAAPAAGGEYAGRHRPLSVAIA